MTFNPPLRGVAEQRDEAEMNVQAMERANETMQDKIVKLREAWAVVKERFGHGLAGDDPGCKCIWCNCERAFQELEK